MDKITLKMKLQGESYKAILVKPDATRPNEGIWIPRSLIEYLKKFPTEEDGTRCVEFTLPEWKVEQENLWEYELT